MKIFVQDRQGHDRRYALSIDKIKKLGWEPRFTFEEAMKETIEWYSENQEWWQRIKGGEYLEYYKEQYQV